MTSLFVLLFPKSHRRVPASILVTPGAYPEMAFLRNSALILFVTGCFGGQWELGQYDGSVLAKDVWPTFIYKIVQFGRKPFVIHGHVHDNKYHYRLRINFRFQSVPNSARKNRIHVKDLFKETVPVT